MRLWKALRTVWAALAILTIALAANFAYRRGYRLPPGEPPAWCVFLGFFVAYLAAASFSEFRARSLARRRKDGAEKDGPL